MKKRFLGILLTLAMIVTMVPITSLAADAEVQVGATGATGDIGTYSKVSDVNDAILKKEAGYGAITVKVKNGNYVGDITFKNKESKIEVSTGTTYTGVVSTPGSVDTVFDGVEAVIDKTYYNTLKDAFTAANKLNKDTEIKLYTACTGLDEAIKEITNSGFNVTLNVNGKRCYMTETDKAKAFEFLNKISLKGAAAWYNGVIYQNLDDAVKEAQTKENQTVYLLSNITEDIAKVSDKIVTIDLNGYTWNGMTGNSNDPKLIIADPVNWPAYINDDGMTTTDKKAYYPTLIAALDAAGIDGKESTVVLQHSVTEDITIFGNKDVMLDLNGKTINGDITTYGRLVVRDSSNKKDGSYKMGSGTINGKLNIDHGTIVVESGNIVIEKYDNNNKLIFSNKDYFDTPSHLYSGSTYYNINGLYLVMNIGNFKCDLVYEICDSNGTPVTSVDSDDIPDLRKGEDYFVNILLKSNSANDITLRGFDFAAYFEYDKNAMTISTPHETGNVYDSVKENELKNENKVIGKKFIYTMATAIKTIPKQGSLQIAQYKVTINDAASASDGIKLYFASKDPEPTMSVKDFSIKIPLNIETGVEIGEGSGDKVNGVKLNVIDTYDGIKVMDYKYAPDNYKLAIIAKTIGENDTLYYNDNTEPIYWTDSENYIGLSSNPYADKVYLLLYNPSDLKAKGLLGDKEVKDCTPEELASALGKCIKSKYTEEKVIEAAKLNFLVPDKDGNVSAIGYDIYEDGIIDYNDASIVYRMIKDGGGTWQYNSGDVSTYLGEKSRFLADSNADGKLYGTIEDVMNIINNYGKTTK